MCYAKPHSYWDAQGGGHFEWIANVSVGGINNSLGGLSAYTDFTNITANLHSGDHVASFAPGFTIIPFLQFRSVWIDFNQNGVFDYNENLLNNESSDTTVNTTLTIPESAAGVITRMRVTMSYHTATVSPCGSIGIG